MGSAYFQVSRLEMLIARLEIFRNNHCGMLFAKYVPERLEVFFFFFLACLETFCVSALI